MIADVTPTRRNLVVVRAGANSLHPKWLKGADQRTWDLIVSPYDDSVHRHDASVAIHPSPGGKWDGLHWLLTTHPISKHYAYIWLPDDDIDMTGDDIDRLFAAMQSLGLAVAQPSLTRDSYYSHFMTNACPGFSFRYTNFVELMAPCLRRDIFEAMLPVFSGSMSGFGIDFIWTLLPGVQPRGAAILDTIQMHHTRPVGSGLRRMMLAFGTSPEAELTALRHRHDLPRSFVPMIHAGVDAAGVTITGQRQIGLRMAMAYFGARASFPVRRRVYRGIYQLLRRQLAPQRPPPEIQLDRANARNSDA